MMAMAVTELAIEATDAIMAGRLRWNHRDPFDRMIVAQAARRGLTIATRDAHILSAALTPTLKV
jgi:PIN domain nuclease of toxin-antitoxin system